MFYQQCQIECYVDISQQKLRHLNIRKNQDNIPLDIDKHHPVYLYMMEVLHWGCIPLELQTAEHTCHCKEMTELPTPNLQGSNPFQFFFLSHILCNRVSEECRTMARHHLLYSYMKDTQYYTACNAQVCT